MVIWSWYQITPFDFLSINSSNSLAVNLYSSGGTSGLKSKREVVKAATIDKPPTTAP